MKNGTYRRIPVYFNEDTGELVGKNWFYDKLVSLNLWWDVSVLGLEYLPIWIEEDE